MKLARGYEIMKHATPERAAFIVDAPGPDTGADDNSEAIIAWTAVLVVLYALIAAAVWTAFHY